MPEALNRGLNTLLNHKRPLHWSLGCIIKVYCCLLWILLGTLKLRPCPSLLLVLLCFTSPNPTDLATPPPPFFALTPVLLSLCYRSSAVNLVNSLTPVYPQPATTAYTYTQTQLATLAHLPPFLISFCLWRAVTAMVSTVVRPKKICIPFRSSLK